MKLTVHFMDGDHATHDFSSPIEKLYTWRVAERTLIISKTAPLGTRIEYPLVNIRAIEIDTGA